MEGTKKQIYRFFLLFFAVIFLFSFAFDCANASFSQFINYQGKLLDSSGAVVADGDYVMEFKLYSSSTGGSELWSESRSGVDSVSVSSGLFSVMLGEVTSFPVDDDFFNQSLYLEVSVGSSSPETLVPRKLLGAVPAALFSSNSLKLSGLSSSSFLRSDTTNTASVFDSATSTSLFASIFNAVDSVISNLTATLANIVSLVFDTAIGNYLAVTNLNVTSTANIKDLNASSSVVISATSTNFYSSNAIITGGSISSSTISGLNVGNFGTSTISQWTNDAGYLTVYNETDPVFMAASTSLPYQPIGAYLTVESDPYWSAASATVAYLSEDNNFSGSNIFSGTTSLSTTTVGGTLSIGTTTSRYKAYIVDDDYIRASDNIALQTNKKTTLTLTTATSTGAGVFVNEVDPNGFDATGVSGSVYAVGRVLGSSAASTVNTFYGLRSYLQNLSSSTLSNAYSVYVDGALNSGGGSILNNYGLYLESQAVGTNNYQLYSAGSAPSYFAGNIGIGTSTPQTALHVIGTSTFQGDIAVSGGLLDSVGAYGANGQVLLSTGTSTLWVSTSTLGISGGSSQWVDSGSDIYFSAGNVGIGTSTPQVALSVVGTSTFQGNLTVSDHVSGGLNSQFGSAGNYLKIEEFDAFPGVGWSMPMISMYNDNVLGLPNDIGLMRRGLFIADPDTGSPLIALAGSTIADPYATLTYNTSTKVLSIEADASTDYSQFYFQEADINGQVYPTITGIDDDSGDALGLAITNGIMLNNPTGDPWIGWYNGATSQGSLMSYGENGLFLLGGVNAVANATTSVGNGIVISETYRSSGRLLGDAGVGARAGVLFRDNAGGGILGSGKDLGLLNSVVLEQADDASDPWEGGMELYTFASTTGKSSSTKNVSFFVDKTVFNDDGLDLDFIIESDTNANALFLDGASGNIGIGTSTPYTATTTLTVVGSLYADHIYTSGNSFYVNGTKVIGSDATNLNFYADSDQNLKLTSVNGALQLLSTGSGGINLNSSSSLAVYGSTVDITGSNSLIMQTTGNSHGLTVQTDGNGSNIGINANGTNSSVNLYATNSVTLSATTLSLSGAATMTGALTVSGATVINNNLTATGTVTFSSLSDGLLWSTGGVISSVATNTLGISGSQWITNGSNIYYGDGNVGVGSSSPSSKLVVGGNAVIGGNLTATGTLAISGTATSTFAGTIAVSGSGTSTFAGGINITSGCFAVNGVCVGSGTGTSQWTTSGSDIYYATGKIAVGTTTFSSSSLTVWAGAEFKPKLTLASSLSLGDSVMGLFVSGKYAYVGTQGATGTAANQDFIIYNISNPYSPLAVGGVDFAGATYGTKAVYVRGKYAYVTTINATAYAGNLDLLIFDVSDPTSPTFISGVDLGSSNPESIDIRGNYAYVAAYDSGGNDFHVVDISDPTAPVVLGGYQGACNGFHKVKAHGENLVYISGAVGCDGYGGADQGLIVLDVSNPASPTAVGGYNSGGSTSDENFDFDISGRYLYLLATASTTNEFQILDVSSSTNPTYVSGANLLTSTVYTSRLAAYGNYVFLGAVGSPSSNDLLIYDVTNPFAPYLLDGAETGASGQTYSLVVSGGYLYVTESPAFTFRVYDLGGLNSFGANFGSVVSKELKVTDKAYFYDGIFTDTGVYSSSIYSNDIYSNNALLNINAKAALNPFGTASGETGQLLFSELAANGSNYVGFRAADTIASNLVWTLPDSDGDINSFLTTDGSGNLSWGSSTVGSIAFLNEINIISAPATAQAFANLPLAIGEFTYTRKYANLTNYTQFRLAAAQSVVGAAGSKLRVQFSLDSGTNWYDLEASGVDADLDAVSTGEKVGGWANVTSTAKTEVLLRIAGYGSSNGTSDPAWRQLSIQFKGYSGSQWMTQASSSITYVDGNVGIGTTSPASTLHVVGTSTLDGVLQVYTGDVSNFKTSEFAIDLSSLIEGAYFNFPMLDGTIEDEASVGLFPEHILGVRDYLVLADISNSGQTGIVFSSNDFLSGSASLLADFTSSTIMSSGHFSQNITDYDDSLYWDLGLETLPWNNLWLQGNASILTLNSNGAVYSNNGILTNVNPSSMSYKHDIASTSLDIDALLGLQVKSFTWNSNGQADFGLIAEEVRDALPELYMDDGTTKGYRADHLPFYLLQVAQKQKTNIDDLDLKLVEFSASSTLNFLELQNKDIEMMELIDSLRYPISSSIEDAVPEEVEASIASGNAISALDFIKLDSLGMIEIETDLKVLGKLIFGEDSVGRATIEVGNVSTTIKFKTPYPEQYPPIVTISPLDFIDGSYRVSNISSSSFDIELQRSQSADVGFGWHAFGAGYEIVSHLYEESVDESGASDFIMGDITEIEGLEVNSVSTSEISGESSTDQGSSDVDGEQLDGGSQEGSENETVTESETGVSPELDNQSAPPAVEEVPDSSQPENVLVEVSEPPPTEPELIATEEVSE